jgi:hypothetical protein
MDETKLFAKIKAHIADLTQTDPAYAAWARENYRRMLAVFFAGDK